MMKLVSINRLIMFPRGRLHVSVHTNIESAELELMMTEAWPGQLEVALLKGWPLLPL